MMCSLSYCTMYILGSVEVNIRFSYSTYWALLKYILGSGTIHIGLGFSTYVLGSGTVHNVFAQLLYNVHIGLS